MRSDPRRAYSGTPTHGPAGFTLVESLIVLVLSGIFSTALIGLLTHSGQREYTRQRDNDRSQDALEVTETVIRGVLRYANADPYAVGGNLLDPDPLDHGSFDNLRVLSDFNPPDGAFTDVLEDVQLWVETDTLFVRWQGGAEALALAYPVRQLQFEYYSSDGSLLTTPSAVASAVRVKVSITTRKGVLSHALDRRELWVYLRNHG